jgi:integrase
VRRLERFFGDWKAVHVSTDAADRYAANRLEEGAAPATVNRELACLRRMLNLAVRAGMLLEVPRIELLQENNVRTGFVEPAEMAKLVAELPEHLRPLAITGYVTGWRVGELLSRRWRHVDLEAGWLRLDPGETKNRDCQAVIDQNNGAMVNFGKGSFAS